MMCYWLSSESVRLSFTLTVQDLGLRRELSRSLTLSAVMVERTGSQRSAHGMRDVVVVRSKCIGSVRRNVPSRLILFVPANDPYASIPIGTMVMRVG